MLDLKNDEKLYLTIGECCQEYGLSFNKLLKRGLNEYNWDEDIYSFEKSFNVVTRVIIQKYRYAIFYHACKPINIEDYLKNGVRGQNIDLLKKQMIELLGVTEEEIDVELEKIGYRENEKGVLWLVNDDERMIKINSHYLLYGSELRFGIAKKIGKKKRKETEYKQILLNSGTPTIFKVRVELSKVVDSVDGLSKRFLGCWANRKKNIKDSYFEGIHCLSLTEDLLPENILSFNHPENIYKPKNEFW